MNHALKARTAVVVLISLATTGCATLFSGTEDTVTFQSSPAGAEVYIDGLSRGTTPVTTEVKRSVGGETVTLRLDGHESRTFSLSQSFNMIALANLFCLWGVVICGGVDVLTGAVMEYDQTVYDIELDRRDADAP
jgi:uncharacterized protein YceK